MLQFFGARMDRGMVTGMPQAIAARGSIPRTARIAGGDPQNSDVSRYFVSREQLGCELGEGKKCHDGNSSPGCQQPLVAWDLNGALPNPDLRELGRPINHGT